MRVLQRVIRADMPLPMITVRNTPPGHTAVILSGTIRAALRQPQREAVQTVLRAPLLNR